MTIDKCKLKYSASSRVREVDNVYEITRELTTTNAE